MINQKEALRLYRVSKKFNREIDYPRNKKNLSGWVELAILDCITRGYSCVEFWVTEKQAKEIEKIVISLGYKTRYTRTKDSPVYGSLIIYIKP